MHTQKNSPMHVGLTAEPDVSVKEPYEYAEKSSMNVQKSPMNVGQRAELDVSVKEHYGVASTSRLLQIIGLSLAKEPYKRDCILQKRHTILRSLLIVATPYDYSQKIPEYSRKRDIARMYTCTYARTHKCTHVHMHKNTKIHVYTHTNIHTHTYSVQQTREQLEG